MIFFEWLSDRLHGHCIGIGFTEMSVALSSTGGDQRTYR
jgi:hypothetical protein